jgi:hypothetical protein
MCDAHAMRGTRVAGSEIPAHACDRVGLGIREPELHPWDDDGGGLIELVTDPNSIRTVRNEWSGAWAGVSA